MKHYTLDEWSTTPLAERTAYIDELQALIKPLIGIRAEIERHYSYSIDHRISIRVCLPIGGKFHVVGGDCGWNIDVNRCVQTQAYVLETLSNPTIEGLQEHYTTGNLNRNNYRLIANAVMTVCGQDVESAFKPDQLDAICRHIAAGKIDPAVASQPITREAERFIYWAQLALWYQATSPLQKAKTRETVERNQQIVRYL